MKKLNYLPKELYDIENKILNNLQVHDLENCEVYCSQKITYDYILTQYEKMKKIDYTINLIEEEELMNILNLNKLIIEFSYYSQKIEGGTLTYEEAKTITEDKEFDMTLYDPQKKKSVYILKGIKNSLQMILQDFEYNMNFLQNFDSFKRYLKKINMTLEDKDVKIFDNNAKGGEFKFESNNSTPTVTTNGKNKIYIYSTGNKKENDFNNELQCIYDFIIKTNNDQNLKIRNLLVHSLLQELQIFNDGNSRTARLFTFALEIQNKTQVPLIFNETDKTFYKSILTSFEHDDYSISSSLILFEHEDRLSSILYNQEQLIEDMKEEKNGNTTNT